MVPCVAVAPASMSSFAQSALPCLHATKSGVTPSCRVVLSRKGWSALRPRTCAAFLLIRYTRSASPSSHAVNSFDFCSSNSWARTHAGVVGGGLAASTCEPLAMGLSEA